MFATFAGNVNFLIADGLKFSHPLHHLGKGSEVIANAFSRLTFYICQLTCIRIPSVVSLHCLKYWIVLTFESVYKILSLTIQIRGIEEFALSCDAVYYAVQGNSNF